MRHKSIWSGKRYLALFLAAVLTLGLCACGEAGSGSGGRESTSGNAGNAAGGASGAGMNEGNSGSGTEGAEGGGNGDQTAGGRLWVEILDKDGVKIYLKDEAVGLTEPGESADLTNLNETHRSIEIKFMQGDNRVLACFLTDKLIGYSHGASSDEPRKSTYDDNTVSWEIHHPGLVGILQQCDYVKIKYNDYDNDGNNRTILELTDNREVAVLLGDFVMPGSGIKLGFDGNFVSVRISGDGYVKPAEGFTQSLMMNKEGGMYEDGIRIMFSFREDGALYHARIDNFQYESDGWVLDAGWTYKQSPVFIWYEDDGESFTAWYYAPGLREALEGMDTYGFGYETDANQHVTQGEGSLAQIMGDYAAYKTPPQALSAEFTGEAKAGDEKYFTPLTPYYTVVRYDYPQIPMTTDFMWHMVLMAGPTYGYMSVHTELTSATKIVLTSYDNFGNVVQVREKCIYENEEAAIHAHVFRHVILQDAIGETFGTEADFAQWIYDAFTRKSIEYDAHNVMLTHEGNVVYYAPYHNTTVLVSEADDLWDVPVESAEFGAPYTVQSGSAAYSYNYGYFSESDGRSTCTYKTYRTFDREQVVETAQKPR